MATDTAAAPALLLPLPTPPPPPLPVVGSLSEGTNTPFAQSQPQISSPIPAATTPMPRKMPKVDLAPSKRPRSRSSKASLVEQPAKRFAASKRDESSPDDTAAWLPSDAIIDAGAVVDNDDHNNDSVLDLDSSEIFKHLQQQQQQQQRGATERVPHSTTLPLAPADSRTRALEPPSASTSEAAAHHLSAFLSAVLSASARETPPPPSRDAAIPALIEALLQSHRLLRSELAVVYQTQESLRALIRNQPRRRANREALANRLGALTPLAKETPGYGPLPFGCKESDLNCLPCPVPHVGTVIGDGLFPRSITELMRLSSTQLTLLSVVFNDSFGIQPHDSLASRRTKFLTWITD